MSDLLTADYYNKILSPYISKMEKLEDALTKVLFDNITYPKKGEEWKVQEAIIHNYYERLYNLSVDSLEKNINKVNLYELKLLHDYMVKRYQGKDFQFSTKKEIEDFAQSKIDHINKKYAELAAAGKISPEVLKAISEAKKDYQKLFAVSEAKYKRIIGLARATGLEEVTVEALFVEGLSAGKINEIKTVFNQLAAGQLVEVIGKDKIARHFKPSYIANSLARDIFHTNQAEATLRTVDAYGFQLIRISTHNTRTELCQYYEGGTFSKDAAAEKVTGHPILDLYTPFHYGCLHNMLPEDYEFLKMKGEDEQSKEFAKQLVKAHKDGNVNEITLKPTYPDSYTKPSTRPTMPLKEEVRTKKELATLEKQLSKAKTPEEKAAIDKKLIVRENRLKRGGVK